MRVLFAALLLGAVACSDDTPTDPRTGPDLELVNPDERMGNVNSHVYGSFSVAAGGGVITSGPANFPGHPPAGPGTCVDGKWINAQGKGTSGSLAKPHPHCFSPAASIEVVLEPISACYTGQQDAAPATDPTEPAPMEPAPAEPAPAEPGKEPATKGCVSKSPAAVKNAVVTSLYLRADGFSEDGGTKLWEEALVRSVDFKEGFGPDYTESQGVVLGYAIDASTLGTTNKRVGTLRIDLTQYLDETTAYLNILGGTGCDVDEAIASPCLNRVITAVYNPLPAAQGGIGPVDKAVEGFLWITPASSPYNYTD